MQPIVWVGKVIRFQENQVIQYIMRNAGSLITKDFPGIPDGQIDLNKLLFACHDVPRDDWMQFAQLLGYSVSGFGELNYADPNTVAAADTIAARMSAAKKRGRRA